MQEEIKSIQFIIFYPRTMTTFTNISSISGDSISDNNLLIQSYKKSTQFCVNLFFLYK